MTLLAEAYGSQGAWQPYRPRLLSVLTSDGPQPSDPTLGDSVVTGAFSRFGRLVTARFRFHMGSGFVPSTTKGAYGVEMPARPFFVDDDDQDRTTPQLVGFGWAVDHVDDGDVVDRYHVFNMVYDPPWRDGNTGSLMAIMFLHDGAFTTNPPGNPLGRFGIPVVGVPFEFAEGDVLAGMFTYQAAAD